MPRGAAWRTWWRPRPAFQTRVGMPFANRHLNLREVVLAAGGSPANNDHHSMVLIRECLIAHALDPYSFMRGLAELQMPLMLAAQPRVPLYLPHKAIRSHATKVAG